MKRNAIFFLSFFLVLLMAGCTRKFMVINDPPGMPPARKLAHAPRVALVLGGGAFRGIAHVGVLKVFEEEKIPIDLIIGTSAGSLVGAIYADNPHVDSLYPLINATKIKDIFDFSLTWSKLGYVSGRKLQGFVTKHTTAKNIEQTLIPFVAIAADLQKGVPVVLASGPLAPAVNASCAIPEVFVPVKMYGKILVDGGVLNNLAADVAREYGATVIIAVDVMNDLDTLPVISSRSAVTRRVAQISLHRFARERSGMADILVIPDLKGMPYISDKYNQPMYDAGIKAARLMMPEIRKILAQKGIK
ncbi:MAG: patatin-like phospholipase family protein [Bacteroidota bacterium]